MTVSGILLRYKERLIQAGKETYEEIEKFEEGRRSIKWNDYDTDENSQYRQDLNKGLVLLGQAHVKKRRIESRIREINNGKFNGKCKCGKDIEDEVLGSDPSRLLCIQCQKEENGRRRRK